MHTINLNAAWLQHDVINPASRFGILTDNGATRETVGQKLAEVVTRIVTMLVDRTRETEASPVSANGFVIRTGLRHRCLMRIIEFSRGWHYVSASFRDPPFTPRINHRFGRALNRVHNAARVSSSASLDGISR